MKVLRRRRAVRDADVAFRRELEEPLQSGAGMLRSLSLVAVREEQHEARLLAPLRAARDDELIDDRLSHVHEIAELRFPQNERVARDRAESVLESQGRDLRERAVGDHEWRLVGPEIRERRIRAPVPRFVQDKVPVAEGAALRVLTREPDRHPFGQQAAERQRLRVRPIDSVVEETATSLELAPELVEQSEIVGPGV